MTITEISLLVFLSWKFIPSSFLLSDFSFYFILFAVLLQETFPALWRSCRTDRSPKLDDLDVIKNPVILRKLFHQILLHFFWILVASQSKPFRDPFHMRVHYHAWIVINISTDHIGRLSSHSCERSQILKT